MTPKVLLGDPRVVTGGLGGLYLTFCCLVYTQTTAPFANFVVTVTFTFRAWQRRVKFAFVTASGVVRFAC